LYFLKECSSLEDYNIKMNNCILQISCAILVEKEELVLNMICIWECFDGLTDEKLFDTRIVFFPMCCHQLFGKGWSLCCQNYEDLLHVLTLLPALQLQCPFHLLMTTEMPATQQQKKFCYFFIFWLLSFVHFCVWRQIKRH